jgi:hypothetical protein
MRTPIALCCLAFATTAVAGCGSSSTTTTTTATTTKVTATVTSPSTTAAPSAPPPVTVRKSTTAASSGIDGVPAYEPSTVVSHGAHSLVLTSTDSTGTVGAFYAAKLSGDGWVTVSKTVDPTHANFTVKKNGQGATVAVAPAGSGSSISISTYPAP